MVSKSNLIFTFPQNGFAIKQRAWKKLAYESSRDICTHDDPDVCAIHMRKHHFCEIKGELNLHRKFA